ncbi:uncharacterized protein RJT21DRAFT_15443 [Scheffersomyces amazonensis]|uniref:uncharacterized protein n=1 Tax=Scheffersomyces amazonensis TaxID=1078765 RepID=UPI00315CA856
MSGLDHETIVSRILEGLNHNQKEAVIAPYNGRLQIIAGPGTGKTKVLTSRVAYLLLHEGISPQHIIVTTFTKKAAAEMIERLETLLEGQAVDLSKLLIGTFHSICFRIIKMYGKKIGIADYNIADERDSNQLLKEIVDTLNRGDLDLLASMPEEEKVPLQNPKDQKYDIKKIKRQISKLKSSGLSYENYHKVGDSSRVLALFYGKYQTRLQEHLLLDFDDCLLRCLELISHYPVLNFIEHVLVDEFQDSNEIQLQLMYNFARGHPTNPKYQNNVTIVGDPDQSIYGFRDAQAINFEKMNDYYKLKYGKSCKAIHLIENYRSTSDILSLSETVMRQQQKRIQKTLNSQLTTSFKPVYKNLKSSDEEASWISYHIQHILALPESPFKCSDIAILVRAAYQTRSIENELVRRRIPYVMVRGRAFWERPEVVAIIDYLRIIAHDNDRVAFIRSLNFPKRGLGEKTLESISSVAAREAATTGISIHDTLKGLVSGEIKGVKLTTKNKPTLTTFLTFLEESRKMMDEIDEYLSIEKVSLDKRQDMLSKFFKFVVARSGLSKEYEEQENQTLNMMEVEKQFCSFIPQEMEMPLYIGGTEEDITSVNQSYLSRFIESIGLYETETATSVEDKAKGKVSISTIHGSKGLEWPIVFVPGLSEGLLPASFAISSGGEEAIDEERRCFYVATTRARALLYLSSYTTSGGGFYGRSIDKVSRFIDKLNNNKMIKDTQEAFNDWQSLVKLYGIIGQTTPTAPTAQGFCINTFNRLLHSRFDAYFQGVKFPIKTEEFVDGKHIETHIDPVMGFTSASVNMHVPKRSVGLYKRSKLANGSSSGGSSRSNQSNQFKSPLPLPVVTKRAPTYAPTTNTEITIKKSANNRAPPYIPNRKSK